jgi:tetratricopeptide (TPR) repeat protein
VAAVLAIGAGAAYWYFNLRGAGTGTTTSGTNAATTTRPSPEVLNRRFDFAEDLLEKGQVAQAFEVVQNILVLSPDNGRALELQARIQEASAQKGAEGSASIQPGGNSAAAQAQTLAADATMAIAGGQLGQARSLIAQGRGVDPSNPRWDQLSRQVQDRARQHQTQESQRRKAELLSGYLQQATKHIEAGDYDSAIATYDAVLSEDPTNAPALSGKAQATGLKQQVELARKRREELRQKTAIAPTRSIVESKTEYTAPGGQDGPKGFESGGVKVTQATGAPTFPAQLIIEVNPPNAQPGQPYELTIRMNNKGNRPIHAKSIELVSTYGGSTTGKGVQIPVITTRINARATGVLLKSSGTWAEEQNKGQIVAHVSLVGGGSLTKTIKW